MSTLYTLETPPGDKAAWHVRHTLDKVEYDFDWRFNSRAGYWTVDVTAAGGVVIVAGQVVKPGRDLLSTATAALRPLGVLVCLWGAVENLSIPGKLDFATGNVFLAYVSRLT